MVKQDDSAPLRQTPRMGRVRGDDGRTAAAICIPRDVRAAIAHIRANLHRTIPLAELAGQAGVSMRTLEAHFRAFVGVAPNAYGVRLRLIAVRHDLQRAGADASVTAVALRYGFFHLGRFSREYRRAFGEPPSRTRRVASAPRPSDAEIPSPVMRGDRPAILILPFTASAPLAEMAEFFAAGLANALAPDTTVSLVSSRSAPKGRRDIAMRYVIQGWVAQAGECLRIVLRLLDAETGAQLWGDAWSGTAADPFAAIDRVVAAAVAAVLLNIWKGEIVRARSLRPHDMNAYQLCLRAYPLLAANTAAKTRQALDLVHHAIERDPDYGLPAALAGWGHVQLVQQMGSASPAEDRVRALLLSARAAVLDADHALVLTARSVVHTIAEQRDIADELVTRALARNPHLAWAWERSGWLRAYRGDWRGATAAFGRALRLDPASPAKASLLAGLGGGFFGHGQYALAARWMERALVLEPNAIWINRTLAVAHAELGDKGAARREVEALRRYRPDLRVRDVAAALHFPEEFVSRVANRLDDLGLPP